MLAASSAVPRDLLQGIVYNTTICWCRDSHRGRRQVFVVFIDARNIRGINAVVERIPANSRANDDVNGWSPSSTISSTRCTLTFCGTLKLAGVKVRLPLGVNFVLPGTRNAASVRLRHGAERQHYAVSMQNHVKRSRNAVLESVSLVVIEVGPIMVTPGTSISVVIPGTSSGSILL